MTPSVSSSRYALATVFGASPRSAAIWRTVARRVPAGRVPLATALIFDLGVFTLVVGATVLILITLAHQSIRSHRAVRAEAVKPEAATVA